MTDKKETESNKMLKKSLPIFGIMIIIWVVTMMTVVRELRYGRYYIKKSRYKTADEEKMEFDNSLMQFRKKYNISYQPASEFNVWQKMPSINLSLSFEEKLELVKGVDYPLGDEGLPVVLKDTLKSSVAMNVLKGWDHFGFNVFVSDLIPVARTLPDVRDKWCLEQNYSRNLNPVSVVICFHDEPWSTLMRTVHSVIKRTPERLLKQIILFDDHSKPLPAKLSVPFPDIAATLEKDIIELPKIVLVRAASRRGLIRARIEALNYVTAPVVVFLDSHCECTEGWLEPLLDRIERNPARIVSPVIDKIHDNTFEYIPQDALDIKIGGFNWDLRFIWRAIPRELLIRRKHAAEPIATPTISGGIFAVNLQHFKKQGFYDPGFEIWGAENLELSFKAWMCGGSLEIVPCSHVGHLFRKKLPYDYTEEAVIRNTIRLAEVWLDDYKKFYYERIGIRKRDFGDVSDRRKLRKSLKCKSFQWYLDKVYQYMELPDQFVASGQIMSVIYDRKCLDANINYDKETVTLKNCHLSGGNQYWVYTRNGELKRDDMCLDFVENSVMLYICRGRVKTQVWLYESKTNYIRNMSNQKCLKIERAEEGRHILVLENCFTDSLAQKWRLERFDVEKLTPELKIYAKRESVLPSTNIKMLDALQVLESV